MAVKKKVVAKKVKRKRWYTVLAPALFGEKILGESYVAEPANLVGKFLSLNLMNVTGDPKKQNINAKFKVVKVADGKGHTELQSFNLLPSSVKRIVRRGRDKITDSFLCVTSDKRLVRVKPC